MIRTALSTVACPDWPLERVARAASEWGYAGVELRSFGGGGTEMACEPALTDPDKVRSLFAGVGVQVCSIATGVRFDAAVWPPVLGHILLDREASVYEARHYVDLSRAIKAGGTRVYGYQGSERESRGSLIRRIGERLRLVCDHARHDAGDVILENGGSFSGARDLLELVEAVGHPKLRVAYDLRAGLAADDDPADALAMLGDLIRIVRVRDTERESADFVRTAAELVTGEAWAVFEWPRLWDRELAPAERVLAEAAPKLTAWAAGQSAASNVA